MNGQDINIKFDQLLDITRQSFQAFLTTTEAAMQTGRPLPIAVDEDNIDADKMPLDLAVFAAAPVAIVPRHSEFHALQENGHRFLLAADGMYLEVRRPWLHFIHRLAEQTAVAMPYGRIEAKTELAFGRIGAALPLLQEFAKKAADAWPNETGDMLVWDGAEGKLVSDNVTVLDATPGSLRYESRALGDHESIAFDLHSHGSLSAFFSGTDNQDDAGSVKISGVLGEVDGATPSALFRLCVLGLYIPIPVPAAKIFE